MKLADKRAVVTGASQGLGLSIAKAFAQEGADFSFAREIPPPLKPLDKR